MKCERSECKNEIGPAGKKYCSLSCSSIVNAPRGPRVNRNKVCARDECDTTFQYRDKRDKYCSRSCSAKVNNKGVRRHGIAPLSCEECKKELYTQNRYCGSCARDVELADWYAGKINPSNKNGLPAKFKTHLKAKFDGKCQDCGWRGINPVTGNSTVQVEHIDGNYLNNHIDNLKVLCPNCHSLTPTYGSLNKGNGRPYRYKLK